jgi:DNA-binding MarR family transcriptional regulator
LGYTPQGNWAAIVAPAWNLTCSGCSIYLRGAQVTFDASGGSRTFDTGLTSNTTAPDPTGWTEERSFVFHVLVMKGQIASKLGSEWNIYPVGLAGRADGDFEFNAAVGEGTFNGTALPSAPDILQVVGQFDVAAQTQEGATNWVFDGEASFVAVDAGTVSGTRPGGAALTAAATVVGVAAVLAVVWKLLYGTSLGRTIIQEPLDNDTRVRVLRYISLHPGHSATSIAKELGMSRPAVQHHLRVLKLHHLLDVHDESPSPRFLLNSGTYRTYAPSVAGSEPVRAVEAMSVLAKPLPKAIHAAVAAGAATYQEVSAKIAPAKVSPSLFTYHVKNLEAAGLVRRIRGASNALRVEVAVDVGAAQVNQRREFIRLDGDRGRVLDAVGKGKATPEAVAEWCPGLGVKQARRKLRELYATGYLDADGSAFRLSNAAS